MNREQIISMRPGPELRNLICEHVMGWVRVGENDWLPPSVGVRHTKDENLEFLDEELFYPDTDHNHLAEVKARLVELGNRWKVFVQETDIGAIVVPAAQADMVSAYAPTECEALCKAALLACVGVSE